MNWFLCSQNIISMCARSQCTRGAGRRFGHNQIRIPIKVYRHLWPNHTEAASGGLVRGDGTRKTLLSHCSLCVCVYVCECACDCGCGLIYLRRTNQIMCWFCTNCSCTPPPYRRSETVLLVRRRHKTQKVLSMIPAIARVWNIYVICYPNINTTRINQSWVTKFRSNIRNYCVNKIEQLNK